MPTPVSGKPLCARFELPLLLYLPAPPSHIIPSPRNAATAAGDAPAVFTVDELEAKLLLSGARNMAHMVVDPGLERELYSRVVEIGKTRVLNISPLTADALTPLLAQMLPADWRGAREVTGFQDQCVVELSQQPNCCCPVSRSFSILDSGASIDVYFVSFAVLGTCLYP